VKVLEEGDHSHSQNSR